MPVVETTTFHTEGQSRNVSSGCRPPAPADELVMKYKALEGPFMLDVPGGVSSEAAAADRKLILRSLDDRRLVRIVCIGGDTHVLQPHAIIRKPDSAELLEAYQIQGDHDGRPEHGWRHFDLATVAQVEILSERFAPRRDFRPVSGESGVVLAQVRGSTPAP